MVMIIIQTSGGKAISIHCPGINASEYFLSELCVIVNVFQAAQMCRYYAVKYICTSLLVSVTCWRTCQNMQRSISRSHRNLEIHTADQTHTHLPSPFRDDILHRRPEHISSTDAVSPKPLSCTLPGVCVRVCAQRRRQFRLRWSARSDPAPAPREYPSVPLSRCGKAERWMGYPVAPAWLLGSRRLNQSQIGLWVASYEYIFLRLHTQENTSSGERAEAIYNDSHYSVDITVTPFTARSHSLRWFTSISLSALSLDWCLCFCQVSLLSLSRYPSFSPLPLSASVCLSLSPFPLFLLLPSGHRLSFKVLILIWNLLQSVQLWTWNTGLWDLICGRTCLFVFRWLFVAISVQNNQCDTR